MSYIISATNINSSVLSCIVSGAEMLDLVTHGLFIREWDINRLEEDRNGQTIISNGAVGRQRWNYGGRTDGGAFPDQRGESNHGRNLR